MIDLIYFPRHYVTKIKGKGEIGSPWRKLLVGLNVFFGESLSNIENTGEEIRDET